MPRAVPVEHARDGAFLVQLRPFDLHEVQARGRLAVEHPRGDARGLAPVCALAWRVVGREHRADRAPQRARR